MVLAQRWMVFALALLLCGAAAPSRADFLSDPRTARSVSLESPRTTLGRCLLALSEAAGVSLSASPVLADEPLVGYVPPRTLRETMDALAELFDGTWTTVAGAEPGYRLTPVPARATALAAARAAGLKQLSQTLDKLAGDAVRALRTGAAPPGGQTPSANTALLAWSLLSNAQKERVLSGGSVTFPVPEAQAKVVHDLIVSRSEKPQPEPAGPILATVDLDDRADNGVPMLRGRFSERRGEALAATVGGVEFVPPVMLMPAAAPVDPGSDPVVAAAGTEMGRLTGTRDELVVKVGRAGRAPILSRQRAFGGLAGVDAGGRRLSEVVTDLAMRVESRPKVTSRGYHLLRSVTEWRDSSAHPTPAAVQAYLKQQPARGRVVPLAALTPLGSLSPLQLSVLQRSNIASAEAGFAREAYAVLRFYDRLSPQQREALGSEAGLEVASLSHEQLHVLLDERAKRAEFNIYAEMAKLPGLRFRFRERLSADGEEGSVVLQALRAAVVHEQAADLPVVEREELPVAKR